MIDDPAWLAALATVGILLIHEAWLAWRQRRHPERLARSAHARLRQEWFEAVSAQPGSEILAVQTLRNSLMSATMTASTAAIGLMGTATLAAPSLQAGVDPAGEEAAYARRAGTLYSWGLRHVILVAPLLASIVWPMAGPPAALLLAMVLSGFDRFNAG